MNVIQKIALKQHFTDAQPINSLMCRLLGDVSGCTLLEPSVGHGAFLAGIQGVPSRVDAIDIDEDAIQVVRNKFTKINIETFKDDFINIFVDGILSAMHPVRNRKYDAVIANPPYGIYLDLSYRKRIKSMFPDVYSRESYGLFFHFSISTLLSGGRYVFLLPDTFLSSVNHKPLRRFIFSDAAPTHIIRFPSKNFESVNFGYGNLCIIAGNKKPLSENDTVLWCDAFDEKLSMEDAFTKLTKKVSGKSMINHTESGWSISSFDTYKTEKSDNWTTLGEIADCKTGIYTGDNEKFIGYDAYRVNRRLNGHPIDWLNDVHTCELSQNEREYGFTDSVRYVPLIRGGHREPFNKTAWAIRWDKEAIKFYKTNKKARFQNSGFYFRRGLSVPMVTTARISASLMEDSVFDQGVVGVFPKSSATIPALLLYLNSDYASVVMKRMVNGSANNSANYLKRLPVPVLTDEHIEQAQNIVRLAANGKCSLEEHYNKFAASIGATLSPSQI